MPRCDHKGAKCIIGDFWTCTDPDCDNGPDQPEEAPIAAKAKPMPDAAYLNDIVYAMTDAVGRTYYYRYINGQWRIDTAYP